MGSNHVKKFLFTCIALMFMAAATSACSKPFETPNQASNEIKIFISTEEFNSMFKKDEEEQQFKDGKLQLMDGTIVKADFYSYGLSAIFEYATAIFYKGELASLHLVTTLGVEEIESALGMTFDEIALVEENETGYQITFDSMFHESNISVYPYEWK